MACWCNICKRTFPTLSGFIQHNNICHKRPKPLKHQSTFNFHPHLTARKCTEDGAFIPQDAPPPPQDATADWSPFPDEPSFEFAELMFEKIQSSQGDIDELLMILAKKNAQDGCDQEEYVVHTRDSLSVMQSIVGSADFNGSFDYVPFEEYTGPDCQRWSNFMSGRWAFKKADKIAQDPATHSVMLVPIILSADKMTVSVGTGNQEFHLVYISPGNIHNEMRRAHRDIVVPLAFLAIPKASREFDDDEEFWIFKKQVYHRSLAQILSPLRPGMTTPEVMACPNGHFRRAIFELGPFIADYPEQVYLAGIIQGWCPKCQAPPDELEREGRPRFRDHTEVLVETFDPGDLWDVFGVVADVIPFTNYFPQADIHELISPDILHQLIKGTFKDHLVSWVEQYITETAIEGSIVIAAAPPFPGLHRFPEGRRFKQWTGNDSKALMKPIHVLSEEINQPLLPELLRQFLHNQLYRDDELAAADLPLNECPQIRGCISVYHCASTTFYTPSERSGRNGMHRKIIRANPVWQKKHPQYDTVLIKMDHNFPDMRGMLVGHVLQFLSFMHDKGEECDSITGIWVLKPEVIGGRRTVGIVHLDSVVRACHLIGVSGRTPIPVGFAPYHSLEAF
ncbi:hypothetical protein JAAARDRAFT_189576 [Jaapia argillacea MUCL 33604]|uniref:C2H2-type domain-containing protein n=1 Tax=Jaapia argillacea MUCL 33604 TaxID=933084 RepID=A0A067Q7S6_9AGAM|nr:hypothetical protein JAAARDRAFT_189576 [Jaapia argillacea MUCL 33604]